METESCTCVLSPGEVCATVRISIGVVNCASEGEKPLMSPTDEVV